MSQIQVSEIKAGGWTLDVTQVAVLNKEFAE